ncbi:MAG: hypothetical protein OXL33_04765, partial [Chloroflexota bacterium]|nr:hypothetical protein [Chloroflexota bacterium]
MSICVGGKDRARRRCNLGNARMSSAEWNADWRAARRFLSFLGETGKPHGNDTLRVNPVSGVVELNLPAAYADRANVPRRRLLRFSTPITFDSTHPQHGVWRARADAGRSLAYRLRYDPSAKRGQGAWYLTCSWNEPQPAPPTLEALRSRPTLGIDINAGWIAAVAVDADGNPFGRPLSVAMPQHGPARSRIGRMRAAIQAMAGWAIEHRCASIAMEDLDFADARDKGRESMGRGRRGREFRRRVADIPTGQLCTAIPAMLARVGLAVMAVDPAYASKWANQYHWRDTLNCSELHPCSSHHGAALVIGRRGLGLSARRSKGKQSIARCSCPDRHPAAGKARITDRAGRGRRTRPARTPPQPLPRRQTSRAQTANARRRNATPFGV